MEEQRPSQPDHAMPGLPSCIHEWQSGRLTLVGPEMLVLASMVCDSCNKVIAPLIAQTGECRLARSPAPVLTGPLHTPLYPQVGHPPTA